MTISNFFISIQTEKFLQDLMTLDNPSEAKELEIDGNKGHNLTVYTVSSITDATQSFSIENKLGEGGFGPVYKVNMKKKLF